MQKLLFVSLILISICSRAQNVITTVYGSGVPADPNENLDGKNAVTSSIFLYYLAIDKSGNLYFTGGSRIYKIDHETNIIKWIAGNGVQGYTGDGGPAKLAEFDEARAMAVDSVGNVYVVDYWNHRVRRIDAQSGIITTFAGNGVQFFSGDGGPAANAAINSPSDLVFDSHGNLYIAQLNNPAIRKVDTSGIISTVAGNGLSGYLGDGSLATQAKVIPFGISIDKKDNLYVVEWSNSRIRKITATTGIITTIAGTGKFGPNGNGNGGPATQANLSGALTLEADAEGDVYFTEYNDTIPSSTIRKVDHETGIISVFAGTGVAGYNGDNRPATTAELYEPIDIVFDKAGAMYFSDVSNFRIRKITFAPKVKPVIVSQDSCLLNGTSFSIHSTVDVYAVHWSFHRDQENDSTSDELAPVHQFSKAGTYVVNAVVDSDNGRDSIAAMIKITNCTCELNLPNVFTPNGDHYNENFYAVSTCSDPEIYQLKVINRWGKEVFTSNELTIGWDGKENGKESSTGVYYFMVRYKFPGFSMRESKGVVTLLR